jgi:hypothetical protein
LTGDPQSGDERRGTERNGSSGRYALLAFIRGFIHEASSHVARGTATQVDFGKLANEHVAPAVFALSQSKSVVATEAAPLVNQCSQDAVSPGGAESEQEQGALFRDDLWEDCDAGSDSGTLCVCCTTRSLPRAFVQLHEQLHASAPTRSS